MTATVTTDPGPATSAKGTSRGSGGARRRMPRIPDRIRQGGLPTSCSSPQSSSNSSST